MRKIIIIGNSGSGKSTMAKLLANKYRIPYFDLDAFAFKSPAVREDLTTSINNLKIELEKHDSWIIEGCYGNIVENIITFANELYFLNPGIDICLKNNLNRPLEKHKYHTIEEQNRNLEMLQNWIKNYEKRDDEYSFSKHKLIYDNFRGIKKQITKIEAL